MSGSVWAVLPAAGVATYLMMPAAAASPLGAWPLTPPGAAALAIAVSVAMLAARVKGGVAAPYRWAVLIAVLMVVRVGLAATAADSGWLARYYANESWSGQPEWSSDFRMADATRIDRELSFDTGELPTHYLNGVAFPSGNERDISEPMTVEWRGVFSLSDPGAIAVAVAARGEARVTVDDVEWASTTGTSSAERRLDAGVHSAVVRYRKPAETAGALAVSVRRAGTNESLAIFPPGAGPRARPVVDALAVAVDGSVILLLLAIALQTLLAAWRSEYRLPAVVGTMVVAALGVQGYLTALPNADRFRSLSSGDDWLGFESRAREILQNGPLMTLGQPLGEGPAYFYHPFYSYVLAAVHAIAGESLFGPIFVHFLILAATALIMWSFARGIFGMVPATCGLLMLLALFEVDFIRYYTVTLLSENLYVLTVTLCLVAFARWGRTGSTSALIQAGAWAGISAVTRPAMMMFFGPALIVTCAMAYRQRRGWWPLAAPVIAGAAWLAVVLPFTLRNWIVAKKLVLISDSLGGGFIAHNVPAGVDPQLYLASYTGGIVNSVGVLWRLVVEQPAGVAALQVQKMGFTLGMVHWFGEYRPHPELVAITLLYFAMLVLSRPMRGIELWPVHAFVLAHWASMAMTSPWNYGYRLILPPYVYTSTLAVAAAAALVLPRVSHR